MITEFGIGHEARRDIASRVVAQMHDESVSFESANESGEAIIISDELAAIESYASVLGIEVAAEQLRVSQMIEEAINNIRSMGLDSVVEQELIQALQGIRNPAGSHVSFSAVLSRISYLIQQSKTQADIEALEDARALIAVGEYSEAIEAYRALDAQRQRLFIEFIESAARDPHSDRTLGLLADQISGSALNRDTMINIMRDQGMGDVIAADPQAAAAVAAEDSLMQQRLRAARARAEADLQAQPNNPEVQAAAGDARVADRLGSSTVDMVQASDSILRLSRGRLSPDAARIIDARGLRASLQQGLDIMRGSDDEVRSARENPTDRAYMDYVSNVASYLAVERTLERIRARGRAPINAEQLTNEIIRQNPDVFGRSADVGDNVRRRLHGAVEMGMLQAIARPELAVNPTETAMMAAAAEATRNNFATSAYARQERGQAIRATRADGVSRELEGQMRWMGVNRFEMEILSNAYADSTIRGEIGGWLGNDRNEANTQSLMNDLSRFGLISGPVRTFGETNQDVRAALGDNAIARFNTDTSNDITNNRGQRVAQLGLQETLDLVNLRNVMNSAGGQAALAAYMETGGTGLSTAEIRRGLDLVRYVDNEHDGLDSAEMTRVRSIANLLEQPGMEQKIQQQLAALRQQGISLSILDTDNNDRVDNYEVANSLVMRGITSANQINSTADFARNVLPQRG